MSFFKKQDISPEIAEFIQRVGFKPLLTKQEVKSLHEVLRPGEKPIDIIEGTLKLVHKKDFGGEGVMVLTDRRVFFYRKSIIGTTTQEEYPLNKISSVSYRKGILMGSIVIYTSNNEALLDNCDKARAKAFTDNLQASLHQQSAPAAVQSPPDHAAELKKWHDLKEEGVISQEDYETKKKQLLNL